MERFPVPDRVRRFYEAIIRVIDIIVYLAVLAGGVYALLGTPVVVAEELMGAEWLVWAWSGLLMVGGAAGFVGRIIRNWMVEVPATWLAATGILIYFVLLGRFTFTSITATTAATLVLVAFLVMVRRWSELQIFASDPDLSDWRSRFIEALRRKTPNYHRSQ